MNKILSLVVPSFNMEAYLDKCLSSLLIPNEQLLEMLEVIVVNDGSTDRTSSIAHNYADNYSNVFKVIDKKNGHYGSCINAALVIAKGKYFRILDADDWFDSNSLSLFLEDLTKIDTDVVFTRHSIYHEANDLVEQCEYPSLKYNTLMSLNKWAIPGSCLRMHCLTYKTKILLDNKYIQSEGICYSDNEYVVMPLTFSDTFYAFNYSLYQYRIGRNEQSVSIKSMAKNVSHYMSVVNRLSDVRSNNKFKSAIINGIVTRLSLIIMDIFTFYKMYSDSEKRQLFITLDNLRLNNSDIWEYIFSRKVKGIKIFKIWNKYPQIYYKLIFPIVKRKIS